MLFFITLMNAITISNQPQPLILILSCRHFSGHLSAILNLQLRAALPDLFLLFRRSFSYCGLVVFANGCAGADRRPSASLRIPIIPKITFKSSSTPTRTLAGLNMARCWLTSIFGTLCDPNYVIIFSQVPWHVSNSLKVIRK